MLERATAKPYAQPTPVNYFPFLVIEAKAEASGGTLWVAQNEAAGSGAYMVNSLRWIFDEAMAAAKVTKLSTDINALSFIITLNQREAYFGTNFNCSSKFIMSSVNLDHFWKPSKI